MAVSRGESAQRPEGGRRTVGAEAGVVGSSEGEPVGVDGAGRGKSLAGRSEGASGWVEPCTAHTFVFITHRREFEPSVGIAVAARDACCVAGVGRVEDSGRLPGRHIHRRRQPGRVNDLGHRGQRGVHAALLSVAASAPAAAV